jgi:pimeloyl-ACP methyl ester carboxylesterase
MQASTSAIEPFFFGAHNRQLYGCYHEPPTWPARDAGVLLCYPHAHEMIRAHRAFHRLAEQLAHAGFPTLRFDSYGTGDSGGNSADVTIEGWMSDMQMAADALRERSGVGHVVLTGMRLGATVALRAAPTLPDVAGLVLWEPLCSGANYLEELRILHEAAINRFFVLPRDYAATPRPTELLGFAMPERLRTEIEAIDLLLEPPLRSLPLLVIESQGAPEMAALVAHLGAGVSSAQVTHQVIPSFTVWVEDVDKGLVPQPLIEAITQWLEVTFP